MKIQIQTPGREFVVGTSSITITDSGTITLDDDHQITFLETDKSEYDVCKKEWGYYATPSINGRLEHFNYMTCLVKNSAEKKYIMIVKTSKLEEFKTYLEIENLVIETWFN